MAKRQKLGKELTPEQEAEADQLLADLVAEVREEAQAPATGEARAESGTPELPPTAGATLIGGAGKRAPPPAQTKNADPLHLALRTGAKPKTS